MGIDIDWAVSYSRELENACGLLLDRDLFRGNERETPLLWVHTFYRCGLRMVGLI